MEESEAARSGRTVVVTGAFGHSGRFIGERRQVVGVTLWLGWLVGRVSRAVLGDETITWEEVGGLTDWAKDNRETLGVRYACEPARRK